MTTRGFLLGKFMPPHRGHLFLCETARRMVDVLTVLVCSTDAEPIAGDLRFQWTRAALAGARVLHLHRNLPQTPQAHPDFWPIWRAAIRKAHPEPIDCVFASDPYVFRLAKELDAAPMLIDPEREAFPVSGTAIRENPAACWADIAPPARPYFQKRLCLLGPESVGKTRLARELAAHFRTRVMPEYGRAYDVHYKQGANWTEQDLLTLAKTHCAMRAALAPEAGPLLVEDTDAVQTAVWAEFLLGAPAPALEDLAASGSPADHYFLLAPDVAWVDDGVRYAGEAETRRWFFDAAAARLRDLGLGFDVIDGADWTARNGEAIALAERLFPDRLPPSGAARQHPSSRT